ncbi:unnamed protein product [Brassica oleracea var. botrytis]|uniref:BnaC05g02940D protein n=3 Tax=Brassica TaxID=3705 RepID=A0A078FYZ9_BRANA|nr:PREDICTED: uncharacterized protein LOC106292663 isoform X1 [Brassica oleracea var. oleracea]XP_013696756.1 uncharacterized protein BNAC05G02940D [Brassica napus]KAH0876618.1 hypothetical protein HID58_064012 [Brassica napus]CAF1923737.1 unnamed protein product [Brassica napus]CDY18271.1 BnaC05g02940D [Brassica napus]
MSTPDPNSSASATATPSLVVTASETPAPPANNLRPTPSQPPNAPPPPSLPYRAIAANPLQQTHNNRPNSSTVLYPFAPHPGRGGFSVRPVRMSAPLVGSVTAAGNQSGYPGLPYNHRLAESMMQFMRARNPQVQHQVSRPMRGVPHFLQPRVAPPPTSILDTGRNKNARRRDALVLVRGRKVRITDEASLYSLSRSWLRNGAHEGMQSQRSDTMKPLPKPLPLDVMEAAEKPTDDDDKEDEESVKDLTEKDLLKGHIERAKKVRARLREERSRKIARYKGRLALLLPQSGEQCTKND